jgi:hypothetical protein
MKLFPSRRLPHHGGLIFCGQILLVILVPILDHGERHTPAEMFAAALAVSGLTVLALGHHRTALVMSSLCALAITGIAFWGDLFEIRLPGMLTLAVSYTYAGWLCVRHAFSTEIGASQRILCGAAGFVMTGFVFAVLHNLLGGWMDGVYAIVPLAGNSREPRWIDFAWLSFSTLTTAGYCDLAPVGRWANALCTLEALCGILFPATLIARIASLPASPVKAPLSSSPP